jgi:hypothetical protein
MVLTFKFIHYFQRASNIISSCTTQTSISQFNAVIYPNSALNSFDLQEIKIKYNNRWIFDGRVTLLHMHTGSGFLAAMCIPLSHFSLTVQVQVVFLVDFKFQLDINEPDVGSINNHTPLGQLRISIQIR